jgi:hypothetical protein
MTNTDPDVLVQRFLDGDLSDDEMGPALHRIADDAEARRLLRFEVEMTQDLAASPAGTPPEDFADRTMATLEVPASAPAASLLDPLRAGWRAATTPMRLTVRPLAAAVLVLALGIGAWGLWPASTPPRTAATQVDASSSTVQPASATGPAETVWIRFRYTNNSADSVAVAGDFSQWSPIPLSPRTVDGQTVWTGLVPVSRGEHEYQFVINGERWVTDPLAPVTRSDGFGAKNAVLEL